MTKRACEIWSCEVQPSRILYHPVAEARRQTCIHCADEMTMLGGWVDVTNERRIRTGGVSIAVTGD